MSQVTWEQFVAWLVGAFYDPLVAYQGNIIDA
jgi:hypothetical protein